MAIDIGKVLGASPSARIELFIDTKTVKVKFARDVDFDVLADLRALKEHGVSVYEWAGGRSLDFYSGVLNLPELAEQIAVSLERDHGISTERIDKSVQDLGQQVVNSFTGAEP